MHASLAVAEIPRDTRSVLLKSLLNLMVANTFKHKTG